MQTESITIVARVKAALLARYEEALGRARTKAAELAVVDSPETLARCTALALQASEASSALEKLSTETVRPLFEEEKRIRARHRPLIDAFKLLHAELTQRGGKYALAEKKRQDEERARAERELLEQQRRERAAQVAATSPTATDAERAAAEATAAEAFVARQAIVVPPAPGRPVGSTTSQGSLLAEEVHDFELDDLSLVPREYLMLDEKAVRAALDRGIRTIPGLRVFPTIATGTRRRRS